LTDKTVILPLFHPMSESELARVIELQVAAGGS
jgi:hypothetical protein